MLAPARPMRMPSNANVIGSTAMSGAAAAALVAELATAAVKQPLEATASAAQTNVLRASPMPLDQQTMCPDVERASPADGSVSVAIR